MHAWPNYPITHSMSLKADSTFLAVTLAAAAKTTNLHPQSEE
jgi:hypothetical protein